MVDADEVTSDEALSVTLDNGEMNVADAYVGLISMSEEERKPFIGKKVGFKTEVNVNELYKNPSQRAAVLPEAFLKRWLYTINEGKFSMEDIDKDFDQFLKMFTWNYLQKHFIKQDNITVTKDEALAEAKALAAAQFAQYGMPSAPEDMLAGYAEKILADKDQGQKIYEKLYEVKVVEDVKSKIKVTEKAVSADDFAKLAKAL